MKTTVTVFLLALISVYSMLAQSKTSSLKEKNSEDTQWFNFATCTDLCPNDAWSVPNVTNFTIGGCNFIVNWKYRKACTTMCDIFISRVFSSCSTYSPLTVVTEAQKALINEAINNPSISTTMNCGPVSPGDCSIAWRITKGACWGLTTLPPGGGNYNCQYASCDENICCRTGYNVCKSATGEIILTVLENESTTACPASAPGFQGCQNVCED